MVHNGVYYCDPNIRKLAESMEMNPPPDGKVGIWLKWAEGYQSAPEGDISRLFQKTVADTVIGDIEEAGYGKLDG